jgi:hypothetical protein
VAEVEATVEAMYGVAPAVVVEYMVEDLMGLLALIIKAALADLVVATAHVNHKVALEATMEAGVVAQSMEHYIMKTAEAVTALYV